MVADELGEEMVVPVPLSLAIERDPDSIVLALAADNLIGVPAAFRQACRDGAEAAAEGRIVTFGIHPSRPATNYGYIRPGPAPVPDGGPDGCPATSSANPISTRPTAEASSTSGVRRTRGL